MNISTKQHFLLPENQVYMCGHSLGPVSRYAVNKVRDAIQSWEKYGVTAWNHDNWHRLPQQLGGKIARLIGADPSQVIVTDSTVVNLFKLLVNALQLNRSRKVILSTEDNFPADLYIAQGMSKLFSDMILKTVQSEDLLANITDEVAVVMLTHVNYRSSSMVDMNAITDYAHKHGVLVLWDLCHSVGTVKLELDAYNVDFAVGCTYKYLNGGPGSPAFLYVNRRLIDIINSPICGWFGHSRPFAFEQNYHADGIAKYMAGTPYIMSLASLSGALMIFDDVDINLIQERSLVHSAMLMAALKSLNIEVITPEERGGHVAFWHRHGYEISRVLIDSGIVCDYREPHVVRLCVNPLYIELEDIRCCIDRIKHIILEGKYLDELYRRRLEIT